MLPSQFEPETSLHRWDDVDPVSLGDDALYQGEVREVVLDIENGASIHRRRVVRLRGSEDVQALVALDRRLDKWQLHPESAALSHGGLDIKRATHRFGELTRQGEPNPGARDLASLRSQSLERGEQVAHLLLGYAIAGVGHLDPELGRASHLARNSNRAADPVVLDPVGQQVQQDLLQPLTVGEDVLGARRIPSASEIDRVLRGEWATEAECVADKMADQHCFGREAEVTRFDAGDVEDLVNETEKVVTTLQDVID